MGIFGCSPAQWEAGEDVIDGPMRATGNGGKVGSDRRICNKLDDAQRNEENKIIIIMSHLQSQVLLGPLLFHIGPPIPFLITLWAPT